MKPMIIALALLADDLGWGELGCYGQKKIPTPNLAKDPGEKADVATENAALIKQADELLRSEVSENTNFPLKIPGVIN